jgi:hypothetical protein
MACLARKQISGHLKIHVMRENKIHVLEFHDLKIHVAHGN